MKSDRAHLQDIQVEQLKAVAAKLRETREAQGLSIEQLSTKTLIQRRLLYAIESADVDQLPEMVYVRGFVKRYADALGLNGQEFVDVLPLEGSNHSMKPSWKELPAAQLRPLHLYLLYIVVIAAAVGGLSHFLRQVDSPTVASSSSPTAAPSEVIPDPAPNTAETTAANNTSEQSATPTNNAENSNQPDEAAASEPIQIKVQLTDQSWMRIIADGQTQFEGVLQEGEERTWTAREELTLRAGNAGGVMVAYNDGDAEPLGEPGSVQEVTYPQPQSTAQLSGAEATLPQ